MSLKVYFGCNSRYVYRMKVCAKAMLSLLFLRSSFYINGRKKKNLIPLLLTQNFVVTELNCIVMFHSAWVCL